MVAGALTPCRHVAPGLTFDFADYPKLGDAAGSFLVVAANYDIEFAGQEANVDTESAGFSCRFDAVPKAVKFQPQPAAVRPVIQGPQTATVVGPAGDEIHTDKYGRVKVFFHWDRVGKKDEHELLLGARQHAVGEQQVRHGGAAAHRRRGGGGLPRRQSGPPADHRPGLQRHQHAALGAAGRRPR